MTPEELAEAKRYGRRELVCGLIDKAIDMAYLAVAAFLLARPIDAWLQDFGILKNSDTLRLLALFVCVTALHLAVSFPLSFYSGFLLEHQFKLSNLTFPGWLWRYTKMHAVGLVLGMALFAGFFWLIWLTGPWWWLAAAGAFFVVSVILGQLAPVLFLPLFYKIKRLDAPELNDAIGRLAEGTGLAIEGVYRIELSAETKKANAMLAGLGRTRRVLLGDTLLDGFTTDEIAVVFAHEIGHHVHRHIRKMILLGIVTSLAGFWLCDLLVSGYVAGYGRPLDYAQLPVWTLPLFMLILTVFALLLGPLQNLLSRHYERQSDRYALQRTGNPEAFRSAFRKLARLNKDDPDPPRLEVLLFHSHPPIGERLAMAEEST
ncbi:MAG: M48 family metallopeptidase [Pirellulales bacterium]|nr:M48 family metallopeptidase [Pirellulales bacterium]